MPFEITFDKLPIGYTINAGRAGDTCTVSVTEFVSSEDGDELITRLEGLPQDAIPKRPSSPLS